MTELWAIRTFITRLLNTPYILPQSLKQNALYYTHYLYKTQDANK